MDIRALYELKRQGLLLGFIQNPDRIDPALAYAMQHRVAPIYHEAITREHYNGEDPFAAAYHVSADFVTAVTDFLDDCWGDNTKQHDLSFPQLEDRFGGYRSKRMELRHVIEYSRIAGRFDDALFDAVAVNAPAEAHRIATTFTPKDVYFS